MSDETKASQTVLGQSLLEVSRPVTLLTYGSMSLFTGAWRRYRARRERKALVQKWRETEMELSQMPEWLKRDVGWPKRFYEQRDTSLE